MLFAQIQEQIQRQREFFYTGKTKTLAYRRKALKVLFSALIQNESLLLEALHKDLGKSAFEGYSCELGIVLHEIKTCLRCLERWSRPEKKRTGFLNFPAQGRVYYEPYGVVLILAPWNYPLNLCLMPLAGAIAAGNCVVLKTSELAPHTSSCIAGILRKSFSPDFIQVIEGRAGISRQLLKIKFDYIFFTGSPETGKKVMRAASDFLTPVTLELGGKSPCLVADDCSIKIAAKRIIWGKLLNAGQTCVAPDYILVSEQRKDLLVQALVQTIQEFWGENPLQNPGYPHIIDKAHFQRLSGLIEQQGGKKVWGGESDIKSLKINPVILEDIFWEDELMQKEIFGPVLPVLTYSSMDEVIARLQQQEKPLAFYLFTNDKLLQKRILRGLSFGGGCINDTVMHLTGEFPFGGVGNSGIGNYHGKYSFLTFSHEKAVLKKSTRMIWDIPLRYPPYRDSYWFQKWMKRFFQ